MRVVSVVLDTVLLNLSGCGGNDRVYNDVSVIKRSIATMILMPKRILLTGILVYIFWKPYAMRDLSASRRFFLNEPNRDATHAWVGFEEAFIGLVLYYHK